MGKVSATQKLIVEDFPEQKDWIAKMFFVVNLFFQKVLDEVNGNIEFSANIIGVEKEWDFIYVSHSASLPLKLHWKLSKKPKALQVVAAYMGVSATVRLLTPFICAVAWDYDQNGDVLITDFTRITGSTSTVAVPAAGQRVLLRVRITP